MSPSQRAPGRAPLGRATFAETRAGLWLWFHGLRLALAMVLVVLVGGTAGYVLIESWTPWDAFYMTVITVTTVGYREVHAMSRGGELFTVLLLLGGVGTAFYAVTLVASMIVEGGLHRGFEHRRFARMLHDITDHFILCGFGRIGSIVAEELHRQHIPFVVIERDAERVQAILAKGWLAVEADASQEEVLEKVGIHRARGLIAVVGTDAKMVDAGIPQKYGVTVVAIRRAEGAMEFNPPPEARLKVGDELVVLGRPDSVKALEEEMVAV